MYCSQVIEVLNLCFTIYEGNSLGFPGRLNHLSYVEVLWEYENNRCEALWVGTSLEAGALSWGHWIHLTQCHSFASRNTQWAALGWLCSKGNVPQGDWRLTDGRSAWVGECLKRKALFYLNCMVSVISLVEETVRRRREALWTKGKTSLQKGRKSDGFTFRIGKKRRDLWLLPRNPNGEKFIKLIIFCNIPMLAGIVVSFYFS